METDQQRLEELMTSLIPVVEDLHTYVASQAFSIHTSEVTGDPRHFGRLYELSSFD